MSDAVFPVLFHIPFNANVKLCIRAQNENVTFMYLLMHMCIFFFGLLLIDSCHLCISVKVCSISKGRLGPFFFGGRGNKSGGIIRYTSVITSAFDGFRCKCTVTLCQSSTAGNKQRSCGSSQHKATHQGHQTRRQEPASCCVPLRCKSSSLPLSVYFCLFHHTKKSLSD